MENQDTIYLLKECDSGTKMAVAAIDDVMDKIADSNLKELLTESKNHHETLGNRIHSLLLENNSHDQEPDPFAKGMSWMKTNFKITMNDSDHTVADLITDGCNMGIKSLYKYLNQYQAANQESSGICRELIGIEEQLRQDLRHYL